MIYAVMRIHRILVCESACDDNVPFPDLGNHFRRNTEIGAGESVGADGGIRESAPVLMVEVEISAVMTQPDDVCVAEIFPCPVHPGQFAIGFVFGTYIVASIISLYA